MLLTKRGKSKLKGQNEQMSIQDNTKQKKLLHHYHKLPDKYLSKSGNNFH